MSDSVDLYRSKQLLRYFFVYKKLTTNS